MDPSHLKGRENRVFSDRSQILMMTLYKSMVRCRLEYCSPLWSPSNVRLRDIEALERVQREFTRTFTISGCKQLNYWDRLKKLANVTTEEAGTLHNNSSMENHKW